MKLRVAEVPWNAAEKHYIFHCPGCGYLHSFVVGGKLSWNFNGDMEKPTFTPSLLYHTGNANGDVQCHLFLTDGKIQFLSDCSHNLKGQTVDMVDMED
jgi:hypothetical protein